jgi:pimeloyl-ACP methyl ester carboxylesterase
MTADGLELTEEIRRYLGKSKILLVGHSWGSALGIHMIKARPEIFSAFVGTGQFVDAIENEQFNYAHVFERAQRTNNKRALEELVALGLPPWSDLEKFKTVRRLGNKLAPRSGDALNPSADFTSPGLSLIDYYYWMRSPAYNRTRFDRSILSLDLRTLGVEFNVPIFFFHGTADQFTPIEPVEKYVTQIKAPYKELVRFEGDHHFVVFNRPDAFLNQLLTHVMPYARR